MTLLDAPKFDQDRENRNRALLYGSGGSLFLVIVVFWLVAGHPADFPWNWWTHLRGRHTINHFMETVEKNDLKQAYGMMVNYRYKLSDVDANHEAYANGRIIASREVRALARG